MCIRDRKDLEKELAELQDKFRSMKAKWENEKNAIGKVQTLREQIEQTNADIEKAQREYDLNKAAELKYGKLPQLQKQLEEEEKIAAAKKEDSLLRDRVTDEEIARIVARWTGIPVEKLVEGEREKLLHLDDVLHKRVIGQDEAVTKVSEAILRSRAGIANPNRPIGSFLFLGPTGVGKTELAKALAQALFDDERNICLLYTSQFCAHFFGGKRSQKLCFPLFLHGDLCYTILALVCALCMPADVFSQGGVSRARCTEKAVF